VAASTIRRRPRAVSGAARANRRQYNSTSPVILAAAAAARLTVVQAEGCWSARMWRRITATTRSTTAASATGATAYAATDRGLVTSAADTFM
jgi:aspartate aminotransferase-like enzyme